MVRQSKQTPDQKKDTSKKKKTHPQDKPSPKKPSDSTVWPCSINGCNKQFAREADLKRHQRTTKLHSMPGFACPQCDARFTRTDALRRHQKSRHNGVVIEPTDGADRRTSAGDEDPHSSGSRSKSRSRTPSSKESPAAPSPLPPSTVPPGGPQSYYRQHTFTGVMIPPPGVMVDGHYPSPVGLPTSATRLHQASWQPAPPWAGDGSQQQQPHMIHPGYVHPYYNPPPQYYRPGMVMHPSDAVAHQQISNCITSSNNGESSSSRTSSPVLAVDPSLDHTGMEDPPDTGDAEAVVIDPSLVSPPANSADNGESYADGQVPRIPKTGSSSPSSGDPPNEAGNDTEDEAIIVRNMLSPCRGHSYPSPHSVPLDQILTEDGEPMLNPAELLTQESLASPPPS
ncbi:hypothetical protein EV363DRAFT_1330301 [Boletus edulis]|uniref:C2H2-type domain-containing protein n=1 Tax=Boletus edulis BED1 TaxID=1328754 RepID=A0AAD4GCR4_BOLED|nr:hypothetical protein EV363DRAFT_1330301 [Boletus edulis]KAF8435701.1 hypothetical protein L210DRAFT_3550410 [Boletus edulis BED1]